MIMPSDKEYKVTKQIMLGKAEMNPDFRPLADFVDKEFGVRTINIIYDEIDNGRPRLNICFEYARESKSFADESGYSFDKDKEKLIIRKFRETLEQQQIIKKRGIFDFFNNDNAKYKTKSLFVIYSAFEPVARIEANEAVPLSKIKQLKEELGNKDLWEISRGLSGVTFFVYTKEQERHYENSEERKVWADKYFDLLEPYNEFGYFNRDMFNVYLDSKENFDDNYESSWFYYYK